MKLTPDVYAVILAGGGGTRLWPLSRLAQPKHLLCLCGEDTMLHQTYARVLPLIPPERMMSVTVAGHGETVRAQLPAIPPSNIVVEPQGRSTGPCVGLMATLIHKRDPDAIMVSLHADHAVEDEDGFRRVLQAAIEAAEAGHLVTLGIVPTEAATGYGYVGRGELLGRVGGHPVYVVERFTEKPDVATASTFVGSGRYFWNSGIFVWKVSRVLGEFRRLRPRLHAQLMAIQPALDTPRQSEAVARAWADVEPISVDEGIMEGAQDVVVIPADIGWNDVGCWTAVADQSTANGDGNVLTGECVVVDCRDTFVHSSGRLVAAMGLEGIVIVETPDAVLVCPRERAQDVKTIVDRLRAEGKQQYL